jgi:hypothetical protein
VLLSKPNQRYLLVANPVVLEKVVELAKLEADQATKDKVARSPSPKVPAQENLRDDQANHSQERVLQSQQVMQKEPVSYNPRTDLGGLLSGVSLQAKIRVQAKVAV